MIREKAYTTSMPIDNQKNHEMATFAGGCFWCTEAIFKRLKGIKTVISGYAGGKTENPSYESVHSGNTGYAEAIQVTFNPSLISYKQLLDIFWMSHDPTTINRDGANVGTEYRSAVFYHTEEQHQEAIASKVNYEKKHVNADPVVTEITAYTNFYPAEKEHKDYYDTNRSASYCRIIIDPKIRKLMENFKEEVKEEYKNL